MKKILIVFAIFLVLAALESEEGRPEEDEGYEFHEPVAARVKRWSKTIPRKPKREAVMKDDASAGIVEEFDDTPIEAEKPPNPTRAKRTSKTHKHGERPKRQPPPAVLPAPIVPAPPFPAAAAPQPAVAQVAAGGVQTQAESQPANTQEVGKQEKQNETGSENQPAQQTARGKRNENDSFERVKRGSASIFFKKMF